MNGVLLALFSARVIPPTTLAIRDRNVSLLYVREHLLVELLAQAGKRSHPLFGIGILGFKISGHFGILFVAQPCVVVDEDDAVQSGFLAFDAGDGRVRFLGHLLQFMRWGCVRRIPVKDSMRMVVTRA